VEGLGSYLPIRDYGIVGDGRTAALVGAHGSLDWLCWPCFDSPSVFAAILGPQGGGRFQVCPNVPYQSSHRYVHDTNVLQTFFRTAEGLLELTDFMACPDGDEGQWLVPVARCVSGQVSVQAVFQPRPDYGRGEARPRATPTASPCPSPGAGWRWRAACPWPPGRAWWGTSSCGPERWPPSPSIAVRGRCWPAGRGPWRRPQAAGGGGRPAALTRALAPCRAPLGPRPAHARLLPHRGGGGRPHHLPAGGDRRGAQLGLPLRLAQGRGHDRQRPLPPLGYSQEAEKYADWALERLGGCQCSSDLKVMYAVDGSCYLGEEELAHLAGYRGSRPVRVGNKAHTQTQLDVYGEVLDRLHALWP